uniref:Uncharacterized protein n=1 Tax=Anguilla anguilla TaxID=7936 RepID=A0A0E9QLL4_ANGAN
MGWNCPSHKMMDFDWPQPDLSQSCQGQYISIPQVPHLSEVT